MKEMIESFSYLEAKCKYKITDSLYFLYFTADIFSGEFYGQELIFLQSLRIALFLVCL